LSDKVRVFTDDNFDVEVLRAAGPVLVDFWATWCPPCRVIAPFIDAVAEEFDGRARVGKVDVDQNPAVAERYGVQSIPTLLVFKDGKVVDARIGAVPRAELARLLDSQLETALSS
jgi:thioredoxin 1